MGFSNVAKKNPAQECPRHVENVEKCLVKSLVVIQRHILAEILSLRDDRVVHR